MDTNADSLRDFIAALKDRAEEKVTKAKEFNRLWLPLEDFAFGLKAMDPSKFISLTAYDVSEAAWIIAKFVWRLNKPVEEWDSIEKGQEKIIWWKQKFDKVEA